MRKVFRIIVPLLCLLVCANSACMFLYCAWAGTAAPHEDDDVYHTWARIHGIVFLLAVIGAPAAIWLLRPRRSESEK